MSVNFDTSISRRGSGSIKWEFYPADVLPLWVADADFAAPPAVIAALRARVDHGIYGYQMEAAALREVLIQRLAQRHQLTVTPQQIVFMPGLGVARDPDGSLRWYGKALEAWGQRAEHDDAAADEGEGEQAGGAWGFHHSWMKSAIVAVGGISSRRQFARSQRLSKFLSAR